MPNVPLIPMDTKLEFERRVLEPSRFPVLQNEDGTHSTHSMAWGESDGKYFAYPTVVMAPDGNLIRLGDDSAWAHAMETRQYRMFNSPEDAEEYSKNYKQHWGQAESSNKPNRGNLK